MEKSSIIDKVSSYVKSANESKRMDLDSGSEQDSEPSGVAQVMPVQNPEGIIEIESFDSDHEWE